MSKLSDNAFGFEFASNYYRFETCVGMPAE